MKNKVVNLLNKTVNEIEIPESIFNIKVFPDIMSPILFSFDWSVLFSILIVK